MNTVELTDSELWLVIQALNEHAHLQQQQEATILANKAFPQWKSVAASVRSGGLQAEQLVQKLEQS